MKMQTHAFVEKIAFSLKLNLEDKTIFKTRRVIAVILHMRRKTTTHSPMFKRNLRETKSLKGYWQVWLLVVLTIFQPYDRLE